jgi:hypothetical protein
MIAPISAVGHPECSTELTSLREFFRRMDEKQLEGAEFRHLLRFAHETGRLPELLREAQIPENQAAASYHSMESQAPLSLRADRSIQSPFADRHDRHDPQAACGWIRLRSWFRLSAWRISSLN